MARNKFDVDETLETPFNIKHLLRAGVYIGRHKKKMILSLLFSAISAACSLLGPMLIQRAIDVSVPNKDYTELVVLAIIMLVSIVASVLFARARSKYMIVVGQEIIYDIRKDLFEHLQKLPFQFYDDRPHGKILTRVINYVNSVSDALSNGIINFVLEIFNLILIAVFMFLCDVRLSLIVMAGIPLFLVIVLLIKPAQRRAWQDVSNKSSNINAYLHESLDGMKITQAFTREEENRGIYEKLNKKCYNTWMKAQYTSNLVWYSVDNISTWVVGAMYLIGLWMLGPAMQIGTLIAISSYAWRFWQPILNLSNLYNTFINAVAYLERIFEMIDEPVTVDDAPGATELPPITGRVTFDDVTFSYDGKINILEHFNLDVKPGESIALVGPTGAGKTTVVNLISRFYNINSGRLLLDGHDIAGVTLHSLRSQMGHHAPGQLHLLRHHYGQHPLWPPGRHRRGSHRRGENRPGRRVHPGDGGRLLHPGQRAGLPPLPGPAAAGGLCPHFALRPENPGAGRGHFLHRRKDRAPGPGGPQRLAEGPHQLHHRPPAFHH